MISGFATSKGTKTFTEKHGSIPDRNFNVFEELSLSNVGIGTYLGNPDSETDSEVRQAVKKSIMSGVNVIDLSLIHISEPTRR